VWSVIIANPQHNHELSTNLSGHPVTRSLTTEQQSLVASLSVAGTPPKNILAALRKRFPNSVLVDRDIYNERAKISSREVDQRPVMLALIIELQKAGHMFSYNVNTNDEVNRFYWTHPESLKLAQRFSYSLVMDATYKTNRFKMAMLHVVGMTSFNTSFTVAIAFLKNEDQASYLWALTHVQKNYAVQAQPLCITTDRELALINALAVVFPAETHLLCVWHINKNAYAKCRKHFKPAADWKTFNDAWNSMIFSLDPSSFWEK
jgi:hypothetical protein